MAEDGDFLPPPPRRRHTDREWSEREAIRDAIHETFQRVGIDLSDPVSVREFQQNQFYIQEIRRRDQQRTNVAFNAVVTAVVSLLIGAMGALAANFFHTGRLL